MDTLSKRIKRKLANIPEEKPDAIDLAMIEQSKTIDDDSTIPLEDFMENLNDNNI